ncbi:hypothetical protein FBF29_03640 [Candidatus Saccharibacteria bacterium oral taxon 488]|nr:hypothetical protein FBF29_03640 [Candidatus Saccharibacteria bacterium oral taxon 488]
MMLQAICHPLPQRCNLLDGNAQRSDLTRQGILNLRDRQVRQTTTSTIGAGVVLIHPPSTIDRPRIDQLTSPASPVAAAALHQTTQKMAMATVPLVTVLSYFQDSLHPLKQLRADQGLVAAGIDLSLERHLSDVIRITQDRRQLAARQRPLRPTTRLSSGQSLLF